MLMETVWPFDKFFQRTASSEFVEQLAALISTPAGRIAGHDYPFLA